MSQRKKFTLDVSWVFTSSIISLTTTFLLTTFLARWLGADDLGLYKTVIAVQVIASLLAAFGSSSLAKHIAEHKVDKDRLSQITFTGLIIFLSFGIFTCILLYAISGILALDIFQMPELAHLLRLLSFSFIISSFQAFCLATFQGHRKMKNFALLIILENILKVSLILAFVWLGFGVKGAIFGIILSQIGVCIGGLFLGRDLIYLKFKNFVQNAKKLIFFAVKASTANMISIIAAQADIVMIGYFLLSKDVGYYSIAISLSGLLLVFAQSIQNVTFPAISEYWAQNNHQALNILINKSIKSSACITLPLGLGVGFFATEIIRRIFGAEFTSAVSPLYILLIARVIRGGFLVPVSGALSAIGRPGLNLMIDTIAMVTNISLNILLIPHFGIIGAALATTISLLIWSSIFVLSVVKLLHIKIDSRFFIVAISSASIAIVLFLIGIKLLNLYIVGGTILCAYILLDYAFLLTEEDKTLLRSIIYSVVNRK